jgi:hypothetical protein
MNSRQHIFLLTVILSLSITGAVQAQDNEPGTGERDESSEQVEESEEAYRRRMELEGARDQETFSNTSYSSQAKQQKIDKLPKESQKNIRDQITDVIIESDEWEPSDVLKEYPYEATEAARKDPELREQEEEAWAEQVEKYHEREAAAFGATRPPMPGSGQQQAGTGSNGEGQQQGEQGSGNEGASQDGGQASEDGSGSAGSYEPYQSRSQSDDDEMSTAGVQAPNLAGSGTEQQDQAPSLAGSGTGQQDDSEDQSPESAEGQEQAPDGSLPIEQLEQLQGVSAQSSPGQADTSPPSADNQQAQAADAAATETASTEQEQTAQESQEAKPESVAQEQQASLELDLSTPGIIAIRDLEKLEGVEETQEQEQP